MNDLKLEDVCDLIVDCKNRTPPEAPPGEGVAFAIGTPHIVDGRISLDLARPVTEETFTTWTSRAVPQADDIILTREAPVGRVARIEDGMRVCLGQRTMLIRANTKKVNHRYLEFLLKNRDIQAKLNSHASGSTVPHLRVAQVRELQIPSIPSLKEQYSISTTLGALDDKIAANERIIILYDKLLQAQFDRISAPNSQIPETNIPAKELVDFNPRTAKPKEEVAVYVDMSALPTDRAPIATWGHRKPKSGSKFVNGDTLLARITPCLENGKTGYVDFMGDGQVGMGSTEFIVMRTRPGIPQEFSYFPARNKNFRNHAMQKMTGTSGRQRVSAADASEFFIHKPNAEDLNNFGDKSARAFAHIKSLTSESRTLAELRDTLLPQLMSGKLRVKDAEKIVEDNV